MTTIVFELRNDTPPGEVGTALKEICSIKELFNVQAVFPGDQTPGFKGIYTANVTPDSATETVLKAVKAAPYVESARAAPARRTF